MNTDEFGLLRQPDGLRAYGAGILYSPQELTWCVDGDPLRLELDPIRAMRQNYRIDEPQGLYFIAQSLHQVRHILETIKEDDLKRAIDLGGLPIVRWEQATGS